VSGDGGDGGDSSAVGRLRPGSPAEPTRFGDYFFVGLAARGGMAEVYRARRLDRPGELFAVKVIRDNLAGDERFVDMFRREGRLAVMLQSPSIVATHECGEISGVPFIAMEYLSGCDLNTMLRLCQRRDQRIPVPLALHVVAAVLDGLDVAHNLRGEDGRPLNLVNRDVSPSNVRLTFDGAVKLLDFGIARALMTFTSEIGVLKGKLSYMSPEQARGLPVDARSDIFSAGIVLHELLSREKLFRGDSEFAVMEAVSTADVAPPSAFNRRVSPQLDAVVARALERDRAARFPSAADFAGELRELLAAYRFEPRELREFMRRLMRREHDEELARIREIGSVDLGAIAARPANGRRPPPIPGADPERGHRLWDRLRRRKK
jgi:serine/threonine-protein kinase